MAELLVLALLVAKGHICSLFVAFHAWLACIHLVMENFDQILRGLTESSGVTISNFLMISECYDEPDLLWALLYKTKKTL